MSHFVVLVIGDDVEGQLAPYQENNMGDCPEEYLEFNDMTAELREDYAEDTTAAIDKNGGGEYASIYDRKAFPKGVDREDPRIEEIPVRKMYTFEEYAEDYCGYRKHVIDGEEKYGYFENPNAKWDWYQIGGRWSGYFPLKPGAEGEVGSVGLFGTPAPAGTADQVLLKDVDIEKARNENEASARETFAKWRELFEKHGRPIGWAQMRDEVHPDNIDKAREAYHEQPAIAAAMQERLFGFFVNPVEDFGFDEEAFVQRRRNEALVPFAVLKDGKWHERGSMGWWGVVSDEKDRDEWCRQFAALLDDLPPETLLTAVDCHI